MTKYLSKERFQYLFHTLSHPADGFYEIRHRGKGSVLIAFIIVALFSLSFSINRIYASFVVNDINPLAVDSLTELCSVFMLYFLFCVGNWSITCLMDGEGRMKDILTVVGYSLLPLVLTYIPATLFSQFIAANEEAFYYMVIVIGVGWSAILVLISIMTIHNYTVLKTIATVVLTFIAMFIIIFVALLLASLLNQIYGFFYSIYTELLFRS